LSSKADTKLLGETFQREVVITDDLIQQFAQLSGDCNPIHFSDEAAQRLGFPQRVIHGMIQAALLSAIVGMDLPGPGSVIHRLEMKWQKPCYPGDRISLSLEVIEEHESVQTVVCRFRITNDRGEVISRGLVQVGTGGVHD
jgi:3-hydroxybutyryl-CoA dehydratase